MTTVTRSALAKWLTTRGSQLGKWVAERTRTQHSARDYEHTLRVLYAIHHRAVAWPSKIRLEDGSVRDADEVEEIAGSREVCCACGPDQDFPCQVRTLTAMALGLEQDFPDSPVGHDHAVAPSSSGND